MMRTRTLGILSALVCVLACRPASQETGDARITVDQGGASGSGAATGTGSGGAGASGMGTAGTGGLGDLGDLGPEKPPETGGFGPDGGCAATGVRAENTTEEVVTEKPAAFYVMLDVSGSMDDPCDGCTLANKWEDARAALTAFVDDPSSAGIKMALEFFSGDVCTGYETPAVAMGELPANRDAIVNAMNAATTGGATPTQGALEGLVAYCAGYMQQFPEEACIAVLVTDGDPNGCNEGHDFLVGIASNALATSGVRTFTVGMEGLSDLGQQLIDDIAAAGNGDCDPNGPGFSCDASNGQAGLIAALQAIRETVVEQVIVTSPIPCEWGLPDPPPGKEFDPNLVNVQFSQPGVPEQSLGKVATEADCANVSGGWYYDDPTSPTSIRACPATCSVLTALTDAQIDILFGCVSEPAQLH